MRRLVGIILVSFISALLSVSALAETESLSDYWLRPFSVTAPNTPNTMKPSVLPPILPPILPQILPKNCAVCHVTQYNDWSEALHSRSVGPGLLGQLDTQGNPEGTGSCYFCHSPAIEQREHIERGEYTYNPAFNKPLQASGVSCAICHMRGGDVFGPMLDKETGSHDATGGAFIGKDFFKDSAFCKACHQLPTSEGYRLNDKLLVNTFIEWQESQYAEDGVTCQACHMPEGRHLFRGIHDPDTTIKGLTITSGLLKARGTAKGAWININNSGVGHYFPTYVTPLVIVRGSLRDDKGNIIEGSLKEEYIGRRVTLSLMEEIADSRIAPYGDFRFDYISEGSASGSASSIVLEAVVYPDDFYTKFFTALLKEGVYEDRASIEAALKESLSTSYTLYTVTLPLSEWSQFP